MATVQHPMFSDVTHDVPDADVSKWTKQGWKRVGGKTDDSADDTSKSAKKQASKKK